MYFQFYCGNDEWRETRKCQISNTLLEDKVPKLWSITYSWEKKKGIWFEGSEIAIFSFQFAGEIF
jgi:hypothetical protein